MSDSKRIDPVAPIRRTEPAGPVSRVTPVTPAQAPTVVDPVGAAGAVVAAIGARLAAGDLDRPAAVRALVTEVVSRELDALEPEARRRLVDEVVEVLADEPAWRSRVDALWPRTPR